MGNKKILILAIILGLLTAGGIYYYLQIMKKSIDNTLYLPVVVAKQNIPAKTPIGPDMVEVKKVPQAYQHPDAATKPEEVVGAIALEGLAAGEQVLNQRVVRDKETKGGLAFLVPKDKRAVTVAIDDVKGVGGHLQPGDHVDVMATVEIEEPKPTRIFSVVAIQDVEVLAVGKLDSAPADAEKKADDKKVIENKTVTLAVSLHQAQPLVMASEKGTIRLMLRNPTDNGKVETRPFEIHDFINGDRIPPAGAP